MIAPTRSKTRLQLSPGKLTTMQRHNNRIRRIPTLSINDNNTREEGRYHLFLQSSISFSILVVVWCSTAKMFAEGWIIPESRSLQLIVARINNKKECCSHPQTLRRHYRIPRYPSVRATRTPPPNDAMLMESTSSTSNANNKERGQNLAILPHDGEFDGNNMNYGNTSSLPTTIATGDIMCFKTAFSEIDVLYERRNDLMYDPIDDRYRKATNADKNAADQQSSAASWSPRHGLGTILWRIIAPQLSVAFIPAGVTPNYYRFMRWRVMQRFVNSNLHVFGTQSLLMGLGIRSSSSQLGALSAALKWVLKDALGKLVRMAWASRMGRRFDSDAKRWRFRSAFVYAMGNFLEITTYLVPHMFLLCATLANCCKQVSMLTSSSTRTAIYNSFRDGSRENIGDITAKGEAQIAFVDLLGIASGVTLSRLVGASAQSILAVYLLLQVLEIVCMYRQLRSVVYRVLNFERMSEIMDKFLDTTTIGTATAAEAPPTTTAKTKTQSSSRVVGCNGDTNHSPSPPTLIDVANTEPTNKQPTRIAEHDQLVVNGSVLPITAPTTSSSSYDSSSISSFSTLVVPEKNGIPTPQEMARTERMFLPPKHLSRRATAFGSLSRTKLSPPELERLVTIFAKERFLLLVGPNLKKGTRTRARQRRLPTTQVVMENCHIVLHKDATNSDIVKSSLALLVLRRKLASSASLALLDPWQVRSSDCFLMLEESLRETDALFGVFRKQLSRQGWESPARFMFGPVHKRADWPLLLSSSLNKIPNTTTNNNDKNSPLPP